MFAAWQPIGAQEKMQDAIAKVLKFAEKSKGEKRIEQKNRVFLIENTILIYTPDRSNEGIKLSEALSPS